MRVLNCAHQFPQFVERFLPAVAVAAELGKCKAVQVAEEVEMLELKYMLQSDGDWKYCQQFSPCFLRDENGLFPRRFRNDVGVCRFGRCSKPALRNVRKARVRRNLFEPHVLDCRRSKIPLPGSLNEPADFQEQGCAALSHALKITE